MIHQLSGPERKFRTFSAAFAAAFLFFASAGFAQDGSVSSTTAQTLPDAASSQDEAQEPAAIPIDSVGGMGDINLYPRRIVIDRRQRIATVGLFNRVPAVGEYEITVRDMVMTPEGGLVALEDPRSAATVDRLQAAGEMLRWSPRRVRLLGNEAQTVRIMARPPADLPDGEYRSHFTVISVPDDQEQGFSIEDAAGDASSATGIGIRIRPRFAISIPVIVRVGETTLEVGMEQPEFVETEVGTGVRVTLTRSGTRSAYGDLFITTEGVSEPIAIARGIGIYPEVDSRLVELLFRSDIDQMLLQSGTVLTATFVDDDFTPGETLASQDFVVP